MADLFAVSSEQECNDPSTWTVTMILTRISNWMEYFPEGVLLSMDIAFLPPSIFVAALTVCQHILPGHEQELDTAPLYLLFRLVAFVSPPP